MESIEHSGEKATFQEAFDNVGKRMEIPSYGSIGRQATRLAKALSMDFIVLIANPRDTVESRIDTSFIVHGNPNGDISSESYHGTAKPLLYLFLAKDIGYLLVSLPLSPSMHGFLG